MKYNRWLLLALFFTAIAYTFLRPEDPSKTLMKSTFPTETSQSHNHEHQQAAETAQREIAAETPKVLAPNFSNKEFESWFVGESRAMDSSNFKMSDLSELKNKMAKLSTSLVDELKEHALKVNAAGNQKVLAVFLLGLAGESSLNALASFVEAPLEFGEAEQPHSIGESRRMQERSLRIMAINNLADRAKTDANALQKLKDLITSINDDYIAQYVSKKLAELSE